MLLWTGDGIVKESILIQILGDWARMQIIILWLALLLGFRQPEETSSGTVWQVEVSVISAG